MTDPVEQARHGLEYSPTMCDVEGCDCDTDELVLDVNEL